MNIALISEHASPIAAPGSIDCGGQNVYVAHVARALGALGHQVDVYTRRDSELLPKVVDWMPRVRIIHLDAGPRRFVPKEDLLGHMREFADSLADFAAGQPPYDVVHANFFMSGLATVMSRIAKKVPLVMTFHALGMVRSRYQHAADRFPSERIEIEQMLTRRADCIIAECPQDRDDLMNLYGARAERVRLIPCGVDVTQFQPMARYDSRRTLGLDREAFTVLQLGRIVPRKGIDNMLEALAVLRDDHGIAARGLIVGGNIAQPCDEMHRLGALAGDLGLTEQVRFVGQQPRDRLRLFYCASDVFVTTPWYEPFGITPLEAMACAVPVIGSAVGGIKYTVLEGMTGRLVSPRDAGALARRLAELHADPMRAQQMGSAGLIRARSMFTWDRVVAQLSSVYRSLAPARAPYREQRLRLVAS